MIVQTSFLDHYVVLYNTWRKATATALIATAVVIADVYMEFGVSLPIAYVSVLGGAISILLAFKNNSAYERWWEARTLWGALVNDTRTWIRQVRTLPEPGGPDEAAYAEWRERMILRHVAFLHALRAGLRATDESATLAGMLTQDEIAEITASPHAPSALLAMNGAGLRAARRRGWIDGYGSMLMESTLQRITDAMGACERIKRTPFPRQYDDFAQLVVGLFCIIFPFTLVGEIGIWTIPSTVVVAFVFQVLEGIGRNIQNPFEGTIHDTPMTTICRMLEREARAGLGETDLPPLLQPVRGILM